MSAGGEVNRVKNRDSLPGLYLNMCVYVKKNFIKKVLFALVYHIITFSATMCEWCEVNYLVYSKENQMKNILIINVIMFTSDQTSVLIYSHFSYLLPVYLSSLV